MIPENLIEGMVQILEGDGIVVVTDFLVSNNLIVTCAHVIQTMGTDSGNKIKVSFFS